MKKSAATITGTLLFFATCCNAFGGKKSEPVAPPPTNFHSSEETRAFLTTHTKTSTVTVKGKVFSVLRFKTEEEALVYGATGLCLFSVTEDSNKEYFILCPEEK